MGVMCSICLPFLTEELCTLYGHYNYFVLCQILCFVIFGHFVKIAGCYNICYPTRFYIVCSLNIGLITYCSIITGIIFSFEGFTCVPLITLRYFTRALGSDLSVEV